jgi:hypothetical protein
MRRPPAIAKRDLNEPLIIEALQKHGVTVERMDKPVDLLCRYRGCVFLAEVKGIKARRRKDQPTQNAFVDEWDVPLLRTVDDVAEIVAQWAENAMKIGGEA